MDIVPVVSPKACRKVSRLVFITKAGFKPLGLLYAGRVVGGGRCGHRGFTFSPWHSAAYRTKKKIEMLSDDWAFHLSGTAFGSMLSLGAALA